jgi:hypothetical protein
MRSSTGRISPLAAIPASSVSRSGSGAARGMLHAKAEEPPEEPGFRYEPDGAEVLAVARVAAAGQHQPAAWRDHAAQIPQPPVADQVKHDILGPAGAGEVFARVARESLSVWSGSAHAGVASSVGRSGC